MNGYRSIALIFVACLCLAPAMPNAEASITHQIIKRALSRLNLTLEDSLLATIFKERKQFFIEKLQHFRVCYNSTVGVHEIDVLTHKLPDIIRNYFQTYRKYTEKTTIHQRITRILHFMESILELGKYVIQCMIDVNNGEEPSVFGLTEHSGLSPKEFEQFSLIPDDQMQLSDENPIIGRVKRSHKHKHSKRVDSKTFFKKYSEKRKLILISKDGERIKSTENPFVDEFKSIPKADHYNRKHCRPETSPSYKKAKPKAFSWQKKQVLSSVRNQGHCGSCWLFNSIDTVETYYRIWHKIKLDKKFYHPKNIRLSVQEILECSKDGCQGAKPRYAFEWLRYIGASNHSRYTASYDKHAKCIVQEPFIKLRSYCKATVGRSKNRAKIENNLKTLLLDHGPLMVAIATSRALHHLRGPFNGKLKHQPSHALMLVGWNKKYFIFKNSWGKSWGWNGYLYMGRKVDSRLSTQSVYYPLK